MIEEINQAKKNLGDFKRKVQTDYESQLTIKPAEKAATLTNLLKTIHEKKSEFNEKVLLIKAEKKRVLESLEKLTQELVDVQYLLESSERKAVPTIPMLDPDEHFVDPFEIDPKLVETIKEKLFQEADDMISADKKSGMTGSRRSSKASISSRKSKKLSRQISASSRQSSVTGVTGGPGVASKTTADKKPKHAGGLFERLGPGQGTVAEDETDDMEKITVEKSVK